VEQLVNHNFENDMQHQIAADTTVEHAFEIDLKGAAQGLQPATTSNHGPIVGGGDVCLVCNKKVYCMEKLSNDGKVYHKSCFKCFKCNCVLNVRTYAVNEGNLYCKPHVLQLFKLRGHYQDRDTLIRAPQNSVQAKDSVTVTTDEVNGYVAAPSLSSLKSVFENSGTTSDAPKTSFDSNDDDS